MFVRPYQVIRLSNIHLRNLAAFSKKESKKAKLYNLEGMDEKKIPPHLKKAFRARKQAMMYEVPSEGQLDEKMILRVVEQQRKQFEHVRSEIDDKQEGEETTSRLCLVQKIGIYLTTGNLAIAALLHLPFIPHHQYWLGIMYSFLTCPSAVSMACISIGINTAILMARQGLNMFTPLSKLYKVDLNYAPPNYYGQIWVILGQLVFLATTLNISSIFQSIQSVPAGSQTLALALGLMSLQIHSFYQNSQIKNKKFKFDVHGACLSLLIVLALELLTMFSNSEQFQKGKQKREQMWKIQKKQIKKGQKITSILNQQSQTQEKGQNTKISLQ